MWAFVKSAKWTFLIGALVLLIAAGSVIYAVATGEGDEGFLKKDGSALVWDKKDLPLACIYSDSASEHQYEIDLARDQIKEKVGDLLNICDPWMLKKPFPTKPIRGTILLNLGIPEVKGDGVYVSSPWDPQHGGTTEIYTDKQTYGVIIYVNPDIQKELRERVWLHELLHAFGLAHDRIESSIMYPTAAGRPKELSSRDIKRLKEAYQ